MLIDSHCHLDASEFDLDRDQVIAKIVASEVGGCVIPAVVASNWGSVAKLAHQMPGGAYTLGIHPLFVRNSHDTDLIDLEKTIDTAMHDPRFVGVGEIGLDYFEPDHDRDRQWLFFQAQLKLAKAFDLPVIMHVRRSQDMILKGLRQFKPRSAIAHAFNGSDQQAAMFIEQNCCLGFGGAMTFMRALQIRRLARELGLEHLVLETDAPDISPEWLHPARNDSSHLPAIANCLAQLRGDDVVHIANQTSANCRRVLPRLGLLL
jgi:TatD DNase family protein